MSLKAPGFSTLEAYKVVKTRFQNLRCFHIQLVPPTLRGAPHRAPRRGVRRAAPGRGGGLYYNLNAVDP
jgi:hypothetical protein